MLSHLHIKNIALIEELELNFSSGLNVLSGETGAGKSIIVDSMNLVLGERADRELIQSGKENASVEASFDISKTRLGPMLLEYGLDDGEDTLIFSRELSASGKNICRINGRLTTLAILKEISDRLVDLHGQHEHQSLLDEKKHLSFLDKYADGNIKGVKEEIVLCFREYRQVLKSLQNITGTEGERDRRLDILKFQMDEIKKAKIANGEEEEMQLEREKLLNSEKITSALNLGFDTLYAGSGIQEPVLASIKNIMHGMTDISKLDERYEKALEKINEAYYSLEDTAYELRDLKEEFYFDPQRLEEIEGRLDSLHTLKRKYGGSIIAVLDFYDNAQKEYNDLLDSGQMISELNARIKALTDDLVRKCQELTKKRKQSALQFEKDVMQELSDLGLKNAVFEVRFLETGEKAFTSEGWDNVEFYISTNPGEPKKLLKKIVSGGEVSRIMLGLKNISAGLDELQCLIFDEIDTGISGHMAHIVGEKMLHISRERQVICVTHLAQIASLADRHFLITKEIGETHAHTGVQALQKEKRIAEIARLAGGIESGVALKHAEEMLSHAQEIKEQIKKRM